MRLFQVTGTWRNGKSVNAVSVLCSAETDAAALGLYVGNELSRKPDWSLKSYAITDISQRAWDFARRYPEHPVTDGGD